METIDRLNVYLDQWMRWFRLQRAIRWGFRGLTYGLAGTLVLTALWTYLSRLLPDEFILFVAAGSFSSLLLSALAGFLFPTGRKQAARLFDRQFGLFDRVSTALELANGKYPIEDPQNNGSPLTSSLIELQLEDAVDAAGKVDIRKRMPFQLPSRDLVTTGALILLALLIWMNAGKFFAIALNERQVQQAIAEESASIEAIMSKIETDERLTPEQRESVSQPLKEALAELQDARTPESAAAILDKAGDALHALANPAVLEQTSDLKEMGQALGKPGSPLEKIGSSLENGDYRGAGEALETLDLAGLSKAEQDSVGEALNQTAGAIAASNPELAKALNAAAEALQNDDLSAAGKALQDASSSLAVTGDQIAGAQVAGQAASALDESSQRMLQAGDISENQAALSDGSGNNGNDQTGQGQGQGSSGAQSDGNQAFTGGGSGRGEGDMSEITGAEAGAQPIGQKNGPGDGGERSYESVFAPERLGGESGAPSALPGSGSPGEIAIGEEPSSPGGQSGSTVPYTEVFATYAEAYRQALDTGEIPPSFRSIIRDYFISLEP